MDKPQASGPQASSLQTRPQPHKRWHSRGYFPHFDYPGLIQGITFRLWDSLPTTVVESLSQELKTNTATERARIETYLNAGYGACYDLGGLCRAFACPKAPIWAVFEPENTFRQTSEVLPNSFETHPL